jgi:hypothetical protein
VGAGGESEEEAAPTPTPAPRSGPPPPEPVTWVEVPVPKVRAWLTDYFEGKLAPIRPPTPEEEDSGAPAGGWAAAAGVQAM